MRSEKMLGLRNPERRWLKWFVISTVAVAATAAGEALGDQIAWYQGEYAECRDGNTAQIVDCAYEKADQWDRRLTAAYKALLGGQAEDKKRALIEAERAWIAFRDANCKYYATGEGTIRRIEAAECMRVLTAQRALEMAGSQ